MGLIHVILDEETNLELYNYQKEYIKILLEEERKRKYKYLS